MAHFSDLKFWDGSEFEKKFILKYWMLRILSNLRILGLKKWVILEFCHVIEVLSQFESEPSQNVMHMPSRDNISFDDFLSHLKIPPFIIKSSKYECFIIYGKYWFIKMGEKKNCLIFFIFYTIIGNEENNCYNFSFRPFYNKNHTLFTELNINRKYKPNIKPRDILFICQCLENMFSFLLNMNIFTYFWLKNPHPDSRFKLGSLTYEEMASQDTCDKHRL